MASDRGASDRGALFRSDYGGHLRFFIIVVMVAVVVIRCRRLINYIDRRSQLVICH